MPANGAQLPGVGVCSKRCVNAGNGVGCEEYMICCETLRPETTEPPKGTCRNYISWFKQDAVCLGMGHRRWHPDLQADSARLSKRSGQINEGCLDISWVRAYSPASWRNNLEGISETCCWCPGLLVLQEGRSMAQKMSSIYWGLGVCSAPRWKLRVCAPSHSACSQQKSPKSQTTENSKMIS